ncbi:MAG: glycosyltransferase [Bacteroidota bacterium]
MKILFLTPWYPDEAQPNHGVFIRDQVRALAHGGHEVKVICATVNELQFGLLSRTVNTETDGSVEVIQVRAAKSVPVFNQLNFFLICLIESMKVISRFLPDILHGNIGYPGAFWSWLVSRRAGIPYVLTEHTLLHNNFRSPIHRWLTIAFVKRASQVITVSRFSAAVIRKHTGREAVVIPNMVDFTLFKGIHPFPEAPPVRIGFLGSSFFRKKGFDILLQALKGVEGIELHVGGQDRSEHEHFMEMAQQAGVPCIFHGPLVREEVPAFMREVHFFVSASRFESFGVAIAEALACGLPVVSTDSGGPADFIGDQDGTLVPLEDSGALRYSIVSMMEKFRSFDREAMRARVVERFSSSAVRTQIESVYASVKKTT